MFENIIDVRNLSKSFDISLKEPGLKGTIKHFLKRQTKSLKVINDISFEIKEGEIVGFLGANGAGKTTILKILDPGIELWVAMTDAVVEPLVNSVWYYVLDRWWTSRKTKKA